jgi:hypothetical protein
MGALTEAGLDQLVQRGCAGCGSKRLVFRTYVDGVVPMIGGEPVGALTWVYDGEKFVDGVFEVSCGDCQRALFADDRCPRCDAAGALPAILATSNRWPPPPACPRCELEEVRLVALLPARVRHEGGRAEKARKERETYDPGFHGYRVDCPDCGTVAEVVDRCPLCQAPAPLRPRPG